MAVRPDPPRPPDADPWPGSACSSSGWPPPPVGLPARPRGRQRFARRPRGTPTATWRRSRAVRRPRPVVRPRRRRRRAPTFLVYTVGTGDNLNTIAQQFGTTARSIAFWNRGTYPILDPESSGYRPNLLRVGWTLLVIPNVVFDEQTLPEPSELVGTPPSPTPTDGEIEYEDDPSPSPG